MRHLFRTTLTVLLLALAGPAWAQPAPRQLFAAAPPGLAGAALARLPAGAAVVRIDPDLLRTAAVDSRVDLTFSPTLRFTGVTRESRELGDGRRLWRGRIDSPVRGGAAIPAGDSTIIINGANATGTIVAPSGERYSVRPLGNGVNAVFKLDYGALPPEEPQTPPPRVRSPVGPAPLPLTPQLGPQGNGGDGASNDAAAADAPPPDGAIPRIDVLVAYTQSAQDAAADIDSLIDLAIEETNTSFANSGVKATVRLAGKTQISYSESGKNFDKILSDFAGSSSVGTKRNEVHADVAVLMMNQPASCGKANDIGADEATAFVIVHYTCAAGNYSFGHEIGHLVGARHDTEQDNSSKPFAYGHAHLERSGGWRTIMGYACADKKCPNRIQYWSNPEILYGNRLTGIVGAENNAKVWNSRAATMAGFRTIPTTASSGNLFQIRDDGTIWRWTKLVCGSSCPGWQLLDNNPASKALAVGSGINRVYQLHKLGPIWEYTNIPCNPAGCAGWRQLDNNGATKAIAAAHQFLYQIHTTGRIWRHTNTPCGANGCPGWELLDNNPKSFEIAAGAFNLFQIHTDRRIWEFTGTPCNNAGCTGWRLIDNNANSGVIVAGSGSDLYQLRGGSVLRYTGVPCKNNVCSGWELLDNKGAVAIQAVGSLLYEVRANGQAWRYTGIPCNGAVCDGWQMIDNHFPKLMGDGINLFAMRSDNSIWRFTGAACNGKDCSGWQQIDNNSKTRAIAGTRP